MDRFPTVSSMIKVYRSVFEARSDVTYATVPILLSCTSVGDSLAPLLFTFPSPTTSSQLKFSLTSSAPTRILHIPTRWWATFSTVIFVDSEVHAARSNLADGDLVLLDRSSRTFRAGRGTGGHIRARAHTDTRA